MFQDLYNIVEEQAKVMPYSVDTTGDSCYDEYIDILNVLHNFEEASDGRLGHT